MRRVEARVLERIEAVFARCPELFRFSVRDRSGLPDHIDPTTLEGELFIFEIALAPRPRWPPGLKRRICYAGRASFATCTEPGHGPCGQEDLATRLDVIFERCPQLHGFTVQDSPALPE